MRTFFLLLVLANLAFFVYGRIALEDGATESRIPELQVEADRVKLVTAGERAPAEKPRVPARAVAPAAPKTATAAPVACVEWGNFAGPGVARAEAALAQLDLAAGQVERVNRHRGAGIHHDARPVMEVPCSDQRRPPVRAELARLGIAVSHSALSGDTRHEAHRAPEPAHSSDEGARNACARDVGGDDGVRALDPRPRAGQLRCTAGRHPALCQPRAVLVHAPLDT